MKKIYETASIKVVTVNTSDIMVLSSNRFDPQNEDGIIFSDIF